MRSLTQQNRLGLAIVSAVIIGLIIICVGEYAKWSTSVVVPPQDVGKDYVGQAWGAFTVDPIGLLFGESEGSGPFLACFLVGLIWLWAMWIIGAVAYVGSHERTHYVVRKIFWSNLAWCLIATCIVMGAWIFGAAAQHFNWYACYPITINGVVHECYPGEQGRLDTVTHILSLAAIAAILVTVDIYDMLGLKGYTGRVLEVTVFILLMVTIMLWWEVYESANPAVYVNVLINSETDIGAGTVGSLLSILAYNLVVPFEPWFSLETPVKERRITKL